MYTESGVVDGIDTMLYFVRRALFGEDCMPTNVLLHCKEGRHRAGAVAIQYQYQYWRDVTGTSANTSTNTSITSSVDSSDFVWMYGCHKAIVFGMSWKPPAFGPLT